MIFKLKHQVEGLTELLDLKDVDIDHQIREIQVKDEKLDSMAKEMLVLKKRIKSMEPIVLEHEQIQKLTNYWDPKGTMTIRNNTLYTFSASE